MRTSVAIVAFLSGLVTSPGAAGDADFIPTLVNMTPDGSDDAARECAADLRGFFRVEGRMFVVRGESAMRRSVVERGDAEAATSDFFEWEAGALDAAAIEAFEQGNHEGGAALILFDCRPTEQVFRLLIVPVRPGSVRAQLRRPLMSTERAVSTLRGLFSYSTGGWQP
jgi:hypothetical protein